MEGIWIDPTVPTGETQAVYINTDAIEVVDPPDFFEYEEDSQPNKRVRAVILLAGNAGMIHSEFTPEGLVAHIESSQAQEE